jgi:hypothetical protein
VELGSGALSAEELFRGERFETAAQLLVVDVEKWSRNGAQPGLELARGGWDLACRGQEETTGATSPAEERLRS